MVRINDWYNDHVIYWMNEDELPDMKDDVYSVMFDASIVNIVRVYPYIVINGEKYFLIKLDENNET
jgi:hypothetical protein